ncbi:hypothetical protein BSK62_13265 [Paenibacillus odorifer]|uniref:hypothetical protein n=1 Tax=Paenibacillus odorifer TaxID=189426 RepID=UPI00096F537B|nr:hypothetical protein [Paenibacillus odorifer]OMD66031.1 hypothetical protein BSK62_13265 [Paenibacillus odorifer]
MSKLTKIKNQYKRFDKNPKVYTAAITMEELGYLLSLLEEKDKALEFYADENRTFEEISDDGGFIARKALNTSSNNEGGTI